MSKYQTQTSNRDFEQIFNNGTLIAQVKNSRKIKSKDLNYINEQSTKNTNYIKLKSVCKNNNIAEVKENIALSKDYFLFVFQHQLDHPYFKLYIKELTQSSFIYRDNMKIVHNIEEFKYEFKQLKFTQTHINFVLLVGQYGILNYRQNFRQINQIIILIENQEKYSNLSYLMKQNNVKYILYGYGKIDQILKEMSILKLQTVFNQLPSSIYHEKKKKKLIKNKPKSLSSSIGDTFISKNLSSNKQNVDSNILKQGKNKNKHLAELILMEIKSERNQNKSLTQYTPRQSLLSKRRKYSNKLFSSLFQVNCQNVLQSPVLNKIITFGKSLSENASKILQNVQRKPEVTFLDCLTIDNENQITEYSEYSDHESQLRKIALTQKGSQIQLSDKSIQRGKHKVSLPWYTKYLKQKMTKQMVKRKQSRRFKFQKGNDCVRTAETQFYHKKEAILQENQEDEQDTQDLISQLNKSKNKLPHKKQHSSSYSSKFGYSDESV